MLQADLSIPSIAVRKALGGGAAPEGPELIVNGNFATGDTTGWTALGGATGSVDDGVLEISSGTNVGFWQAVAVDVGATYRLRGILRNGTATDVRIRAAAVDEMGAIVPNPPLAESEIITATINTPVEFDLVTPSAVVAFYLRKAGFGTGYFSAVSMRKVL